MTDHETLKALAIAAISSAQHDMVKVTGYAEHVEFLKHCKAETILSLLEENERLTSENKELLNAQL